MVDGNRILKIITIVVLIIILIFIIVEIFIVATSLGPPANSQQVGQSCDPAITGKGCEASLYCGPNKICQSGAIVGSTCVIGVANQCTSPNYCMGTTSSAAGTVGICSNGAQASSCSTDAQCQQTNPSLFCSITTPNTAGICTLPQLGAPCTNSNQCGTGYCAGSPQLCRSGSVGDPCVTTCGNSGNYCAPNFLCANGAVGASCANDAQCAIAGNICGPAATTGGPRFCATPPA